MSTWIKQYYYIVYFKDFLRPRVFPVYFTSPKAAKRAIKENVKSPKKRALYEVVKGSKLEKFNFTYVLRLGKLGEFKKWEYPKELDTIQKRKSYRTRLRRRLRRMGMLTPVKNKYSINKPIEQVRLIQNRQEIANSPETIARVFRLERKPRDHYFIILDKRISKKKGILFEVDCLRVDVKTKMAALVHLQIQRKDIIIPYLLTELIKIYGNEDILERARQAGLSLNSPTQKGNLTKGSQGMGNQPGMGHSVNHGVAI